MKLAYFDCFSGISGDMILGALVDSGVPLERLRIGLTGLKLGGYDIAARLAVKNGITGTRVEVTVNEAQPVRHLRDIETILDKSELPPAVKEKSKQVFVALARAEAKIHNTTPDRIHFHEVGAVDAVVDVVGAVLGLHLLGIERLVVSRIHVGTGFVDCQHGRIPIPSPATTALLQGAPVFSTGIEAELTTPTGAAIVSTLADEFGPLPAMTPIATGYGAGMRDLGIPNMLRLIIGQSELSDSETDFVSVIETNIDDMTGEQLGYAVEKLMGEGALDVWLTPIQMKKGRPGHMLSVMASQGDVEPLARLVLSETTTLGVRLRRCERRKQFREMRTVRTRFGEVRVKVSISSGEVVRVAPEYEDCRAIADREGEPFPAVFDQVRRQAERQLLDWADKTSPPHES